MMFSACRIGHSVRKVSEKPAMCGVNMQFGRRNSGSRLSTGSISVTSKAAASSCPASKAAASAVPSIIGPRAVFTNSAVGFSLPSALELNICRVSLVAAQWMVM